jgi:predicted TIM-barrel fold metal-dependent hydrolase
VSTIIIDTHTHVVSHDRVAYPMQPPADLARMGWFDEFPVDAGGLLDALDAGGVHGAVLVQAKGAYGYDNSYAADAVGMSPRFVAASIVDMAAPDRLAVLEDLAARGMGGTRLFNIPPASPSWLVDPATVEVLDRCRALGVRVALCILEPDLPNVRSLCALAPDLPIALDHCGFIDLLGDTSALDALADVDNLRLKVTTTMLEPAIHAGRDPRDVLERLCDVFGVERLMWGSDFPQHHSEPYAEIAALARRSCERLTAAEQARFLGGTALELWPELAP